jgi:hypothetical protein
MAIARTLTFSDIKLLAGMPRPTVLRVVPADKPEEYTQLTYSELELGLEISDSFFSLARLKRK